MNNLIGNGSHLYRRASHLVRTPITVTLSPDAMAVYGVAYEYTTSGAQHWPARGWYAQNTLSNVYDVGSNMIQAYLRHADSRQMWHSVNTSHEPETAWYQGAYATSATSLAMALQQCEAFLQLGAYHFTVPDGLSSLDISKVLVRFVNGGGSQAYQGAYNASNNNKALRGYGDFTSWYLPFHVMACDTMEGQTPQSVAASPYDAQVDILADSGEFKGARDLWGFSGTSRDGGLVTLTNPPVKSYEMGSSTVSKANETKGFWIIPFVGAEWSGSRSYVPYYANATNGYWGSICVWGLSVDVTVGG